MKKVLGITAGFFLLLLLAVYGAGCWYFQTHFYYGTTIEGTVYGCLEKQQVRDDLIQKQGSYQMKILGRRGLEDTLKGTEAGLVFEPGEELQGILNRQIWYLWPLSFFEEHVYELTDSIRIDEEQFRAAAEKLSVFQRQNMKAPKDAYLSDYSSFHKGYVVIPEQEGNLIRKETALKAVREAFAEQKSEIVLRDNRFYLCPRIYADDETLLRRAEQRNVFTRLTFTYDMHGVEAVVDGDQIHSWLVEEDGEVRIDEEKALACVQELADTYDTYGKVRSFRTVKGEVKHLKSGAYGWRMDVKAEQEAFLAMLREGKSCKREPKWLKKGYAEGESDIGDTYVEIDLGGQHLYLIDQGEVILDSKLVSGNAARGWSTPAGVFGITYKTRNAVLRGADYATPVSYWMPFNRNIGMHDASWRGSFGGNIYKTGGSHGCINLPFKSAKQIYNFVKTNMPVVCYY
ncbi:MAG: L,D-transpeptidase/peptidoglycan binding protein [Clostridiales bacterium]|nr:L,D-transpeptidase/peptidoglycan binding protein [Clostridiales bacterium]